MPEKKQVNLFAMILAFGAGWMVARKQNGQPLVPTPITLEPKMARPVTRPVTTRPMQPKPMMRPMKMKPTATTRPMMVKPSFSRQRTTGPRTLFINPNR